MTSHGPYHRLGGPGGPGCRIGVLPVNAKNADGTYVEADLLDAGNEVSELELLRTVAIRFSVRWGHDDFGWWAMAPKSPPLQKP